MTFYKFMLIGFLVYGVWVLLKATWDFWIKDHDDE